MLLFPDASLIRQPNAVNCFLLFEGMFAVLLVAFNFITWRVLSKNEEHFIRTYQAWRLLPWIPLYIGAFLAGWGSFYTAPGALDRATSASRGRVRWVLGLVPRPLFVNIICFGTPVLLAGSIIAPVYLGTRQLSRGYDAYLDWVALTNRTTALDTSSAEQILSQASLVWNTISKSYYYTAVGYAVWSFWALVFLAFYIPAGGYLVVLLWQQVKHHQALLLSWQKQKAAAGQPVSLGSGSAERVINMRDIQANGGAGVGGSLNARSQASSTAVPEEGMSPPVSPLWKLRKSFRADAMAAREESNHRRLSGAGAGAGGSSPRSKVKYLRRCLVNLVMLYVGVIAAAIIFTVITVRLAAREYESALEGPGALAGLLLESDLMAAYASCVFGFLTVGSIWLRNFDSGAMDQRRSTPFVRNSKDAAAAAAAAAGAGAGWQPVLAEKTRTLPAVPESVGVDTSVSMSQAGDMRAIKFSLARDQPHANGLVLQPDESHVQPPHAIAEEDLASEQEHEHEQEESLVFYPTPFGPVPAPAPARGVPLSGPTSLRSSPRTDDSPPRFAPAPAPAPRSRTSIAMHESAASRIAREWQMTQYARAPLPRTPPH